MAGRIRQDDVQAVRERSDLVKVVSEHLQLKKAGRDSMVGLCPFHPEKTPSFSVSPAKQVYHCFGCGEGGDVFKFLEKMENLTFTEAVERLAAVTGVRLRYEGQTDADRRTSGRRQVIHGAIAEAGRLYQRMLTEGREAAEARAYLDARGIPREGWDRFGIGYAPGYADYLLRRMSKDFSTEILLEAGLVAADPAGAVRDRFRGRVMFPIHDVSGNAVGFGGRLLAGPGAPANAAKYVNSPDGPVYRKGSLLYNLNRARAEIIRTGRALLVEGYTDVIALDQAGIKESVATCGTALAEEHLRLLSRSTSRVILAFDSDQAGARAAERAFQFHERYPVDVSVVILPEGQDPADFAMAHGEATSAAFDQLVERAMPVVEYMIDRLLVNRDLSTAEGQSRAVHDVVEEVLLHIGEPVLRERYAAVIAAKVGRTDVSENAVLLELRRLEGADGPSPSPGARRIPPGQKVEREALKLLVQVPELCADRRRTLQADRFPTPAYRKVFELLGSVAPDAEGADSAAAVAGPERNASRPGVAALVALGQERGEQIGKLVAALAVEPLETGGEPTLEYVERVFLRLEEFALTRRIDELRGRLERLNPLKATGEYDDLFEQLVGLEGARRRVRAEAESAVFLG